MRSTATHWVTRNRDSGELERIRVSDMETVHLLRTIRWLRTRYRQRWEDRLGIGHVGQGSAFDPPSVAALDVQIRGSEPSAPRMFEELRDRGIDLIANPDQDLQALIAANGGGASTLGFTSDRQSVQDVPSGIIAEEVRQRRPRPATRPVVREYDVTRHSDSTPRTLVVPEGVTVQQTDGLNVINVPPGVTFSPEDLDALMAQLPAALAANTREAIQRAVLPERRPRRRQQLESEYRQEQAAKAEARQAAQLTVTPTTGRRRIKL